MTERDRIIHEALAEFEDAVNGRAVDPVFSNLDREFICSFVIRNVDDPTAQKLWAEFVERFGMAGDH